MIIQKIKFGANFLTNNVENMKWLFANCSNLTEVDISSFDTTKTVNTYGMFSSCTNLKTIYVSTSFTNKNVEDGENMFYNCQNLVGENGTQFNLSHIDKEYARIDGIDDGEGNQLPGYFTLKQQ